MKKTAYTGDRRKKPDDDVKIHQVKVRLTDAAFDDFFRGAQMATGGQVAPFILECAEIGLRMKQESQRKLMLRLSGIEKIEPDTDTGSEERELLVEAMRDLIRAGITASSKHRSRAA